MSADEDLDAAERDARVDDARTWLRRQREAREEHCAQTGNHPPRSPAEQTVLDLLDEAQRLIAERDAALAEVQRLKQEVTYADRAMRERHGRFATLHADVSILARELGVLGAEEYAPDDHDALCDFMRRAQNEVENLRIAATLGPRVAEANAAVERAASVARLRDVLAAIDARPEMYAQTPEHAASVLSGVHLAGGGNGASWVATMTALGFTRGNVYLPVTTWDDVRRLARHLRETAETWVGTR